jgi:hypothetical protein
MLEAQQLAARKAIEALRAGVPNRDAVNALGVASPAIADRFGDLLATVAERGVEPQSPTGFLVAGGFGAGKSHLLEYLQHLALARNFVTSKVVISKETPLHDPVKFYRAAIGNAVAQGRRGPALAEIATELQPRSEAYHEFYSWVQGTRELNQRFAATLYLHEHAQQDPELQDRIQQFWAGDPITVGDLKRALKAQGEGMSYVFEPIDARTLALQRFRFVARLILAAGYAGWVLLVDEAELIARYSVLQRARSYAEIARWTGNLKGEIYPGLASVFAITSDYEPAILEARRDREHVPARLRATGREADDVLAGQAERGMRLIGRALRLPPPSRPVIRKTYEHLRSLHGAAYAWEPPAVGSAPYATSTSMREYVRWWITEWDLKRLDPTYEPSLEVTHLAPDLSEDELLEQPYDEVAGDPALPWADSS